MWSMLIELGGISDEGLSSLLDVLCGMEPDEFYSRTVTKLPVRALVADNNGNGKILQRTATLEEQLKKLLRAQHKTHRRKALLPNYVRLNFKSKRSLVRASNISIFDSMYFHKLGTVYKSTALLVQLGRVLFVARW